MAQKVTLKGEYTLQQIFAEVKKQTNYAVIYNPDMVDVRGRVSVDASKQSLESFIKTILINFPYTYNVSGSNIIISKREEIISPLPAPGERSIAGQVNESKTNQPIRGVTVTVNGKNIATQTGTDGRFLLKNVPEEFSVSLTSVGYEKVTVKVSKTELFLPVAMKVAVDDLDEAVVRAYGTTSKRRSTGNIVKVSGEEIRKMPVQNPILALQGRVPGLIVTPVGGSASGQVKLEIRGRNALNPDALSEPLIIIDGIPQTILEVKGSTRYGAGVSGGNIQGGASATRGQSQLFGLNAMDIESIEVLKDGDATAIYGTRGANGVIMITSKKPKAGKTSLSFGTRQGVNFIARKREMLNTEQYLAMRREAFKNDGIIPTAETAPDLFLWDQNRYTDWQKELMGTGKFSSYDLGLKGGDARTSFSISAQHTNTVDLQSRSGHNKTSSMNVFLNHSSLNRKFNISLNAGYVYADVNAINDQNSGYFMPPNAPPIFDERGNLNFAAWPFMNAFSTFPFSYVLISNEVKSNKINGTLGYKYDITNQLSISGNVGITNTTVKSNLFTPIAAQHPGNNPTGRAFFGTTGNNNFLLQQQVNYNVVVGKGVLSLLAGGSVETAITTGSNLVGVGFSNDDLLRSITNATAVQTAQDGRSSFKQAKVFGQAQYSFDERYNITLTGTRDGSSRFLQGKQYGNFGSIGASWNVTEETWMKKILPAWVSFLQLKGSYGITGDAPVSDYEFIAQWANRNGTAVNAPLIYDYNGLKSFVRVIPANQQFQWSDTRKYDLSFESSFFNKRLKINGGWYKHVVSDQITSMAMAPYTGLVRGLLMNSPAVVHNSGLEGSINATLISNKNVNWTVNMQIGHNKNRLVKFPGIENTPYVNQFMVGTSLNTTFVKRYLGVNPLTGDYMFEDYNKDGKVTRNSTAIPGTKDDDFYIPIDRNPDFTGGFGTAISYGNFSLSVQFEFFKGVSSHPFSSLRPGLMQNMVMPDEILNDHWQKPGDIASYARFSSSGSNTFTQSDREYIDASYIRLNMLNMAYNIPQRLLKMTGMQSCAVGLSATNLLSITNFKADPSIMNGSFISQPNTVTFNLSINF
ncbi:MAG: SusC/RagA family TonB-linked outer membrane protein [Pseudobacter sp.]|uniref:SusC/RagA family TonB-linked outer membrane protein n=1 Tax=Pseudobacter sp. TaxID=2045420 RepID=UPI003F7D807F